MKLIGVEAGGKGIASGKHEAMLGYGSRGVFMEPTAMSFRINTAR